MSTVGPSLLFGLVGGVLAAVLFTPLVLAVWALRRPRPACPHCSAALPRLSRPRNLDQALWGRRTCPNCGQGVVGRGARGQ